MFLDPSQIHDSLGMGMRVEIDCRQVCGIYLDGGNVWEPNSGDGCITP